MMTKKGLKGGNESHNTTVKIIMKRIVVFCVIVVSLCTVFVVFLYFGILRFNYPDRKRFPIRGIDVSHHQQSIDWGKLRHENVRFAFIKATEGGDFKDSLFVHNWHQAQHAKIVRGAYHFFTFCKPGKEQAQNFIETVPKEPHTLPPVIDLEFGGNCQARPSRQAFLKELTDYIDEIERVYHQAPMFYLTYEFYDQYLQGELEAYSIWIRDIFKYPRLQDQRKWDFWQYSNRGKLKGIETFVDLNVFHGDEIHFMKLLQ